MHCLCICVHTYASMQPQKRKEKKKSQLQRDGDAPTKPGKRGHPNVRKWHMPGIRCESPKTQGRTCSAGGSLWWRRGYFCRWDWECLCSCTTCYFCTDLETHTLTDSQTQLRRQVHEALRHTAYATTCVRTCSIYAPSTRPQHASSHESARLPVFPSFSLVFVPRLLVSVCPNSSFIVASCG